MTVKELDVEQQGCVQTAPAPYRVINLDMFCPSNKYTVCSLPERHRRFGGTIFLYFQERGVVENEVRLDL
jgi:hypothetical protein